VIRKGEEERGPSFTESKRGRAKLNSSTQLARGREGLLSAPPEREKKKRPSLISERKGITTSKLMSCAPLDGKRRGGRLVLIP